MSSRRFHAECSLCRIQVDACEMVRRKPSYPRGAPRNSPMKSCATCKRAFVRRGQDRNPGLVLDVNGRVTRLSVAALDPRKVRVARVQISGTVQ